MRLYETIFIRRSARKYNKTELNDDILKEVDDLLKGTKQMDGQNARFEIVSDSEVKGPASNYILAFSEDNDSAYANVGYILQKADLFVQSKGLGSLYLGMKKPKMKNDDFCILLVFGESDVPFRKGEEDFKRLPIEEISSSDNIVARAARLAPSAQNYQPWKLIFGENRVIIDYVGRGLLKGVFRKKLSMIDMGIVTRHIEETLIEEGKTVTSITSKTTDRDFRIEVLFS